VCSTHGNLCITFVIAGNFDEIITRSGLVVFILQPKLRKRKERMKQFLMSESTKKRKLESTIIHGRPQKFFHGGQRRHFVYHFQIAEHQCSL